MDSYSRPLYQESQQLGLSQGSDQELELAQEALKKEPIPKGEPRVGTFLEKLKLNSVC